MTGRWGIVLGLALLMGFIAEGNSSDLGRSLSSDIQDAVRNILSKIIHNPLVNPALKLSDVKINIDSGSTKLDGDINGEITGIKETQLVKNKFAIIGMKHTVGLEMSNLTAAGDYNLNGTVAGLLRIHGGGPFVIQLENLSANIVVYVKAKTDTTRLPPLLLRNVTVDLSLGSLHVQLDNILGELSDAFNDMVNELGPEFINMYEPQIEGLVADLLFDLISGILPGGGRGGETPEVDLSQVNDLAEHILSQLIAKTFEKIL